MCFALTETVRQIEMPLVMNSLPVVKSSRIVKTGTIQLHAILGYK